MKLLTASTSGVGRTMTYTSYNQPVTVTNGASSLSFYYDMDHQRVMRAAAGTTTLYLDAFGVRSELLTSSTVTCYDYISVGGALVAMRSVSGATVATRYMLVDHLGSTCVLTDETGTVVERDG